MKAFLNIEFGSMDELATFAVKALGSGGTASTAAAAATEAPKATARKTTKTVEPLKETPAPAAQEDAAVDLGLGDEPAAEVIDKALVSKELRAFIAAKGAKEGPLKALAVLKEFGASKFDELKPEHYAKFLSKLKEAS